MNMRRHLAIYSFNLKPAKKRNCTKSETAQSDIAQSVFLSVKAAILNGNGEFCWTEDIVSDLNPQQIGGALTNLQKTGKIMMSDDDPPQILLTESPVQNAAEIKSVRKSLNLSQEAAAQVLGITRQKLANMESGRTRVPDEVMVRLDELRREGL